MRSDRRLGIWAPAGPGQCKRVHCTLQETGRFSNIARPTLRFRFLFNFLYRPRWFSKSHLPCNLWRPVSGQTFSKRKGHLRETFQAAARIIPSLQMLEHTRPLIVDFFFLLLYCKNNVASKYLHSCSPHVLVRETLGQGASASIEMAARKHSSKFPFRG